MDKKELEQLIKERQKEAAGIAGSIQLNWKITHWGEQTIFAEYTIENKSNENVYLLDKTLCFANNQKFALKNKGCILLEQKDKKGKLTLYKGYVSPPLSEVQQEIMPGATVLKAGAVLNGEINIPLPLHAWHPNEGDIKLKNVPETIDLKMSVLPVFCKMQELELADNSVALVPKQADAHLYQQWISTEEQELPASIVRI